MSAPAPDQRRPGPMAAAPATAAWRAAGAVAQGVALGLLLAVALLNLAAVASDAQVFRYQGF